jgi:hypothetical protein
MNSEAVAGARVKRLAEGRRMFALSVATIERDVRLHDLTEDEQNVLIGAVMNAADRTSGSIEALDGLVRAVNTGELAAAMACHSVVSFANVEDALKPAIAALKLARSESPNHE